MLAAPGTGESGDLGFLTPNAHPASTASRTVKAHGTTTPRANPINKQSGRSAGLGHFATDHFVVVDQVVPINDWMADPFPAVFCAGFTAQLQKRKTSVDIYD